MSGKKKKTYRINQPAGKGKNAGASRNANSKNTERSLSLSGTAARPKAAAQSKMSKKAAPPSPLFDKNNVLELLTRVFLIAMAIIFPLAMGEEKYGSITHFKNSAFYVIAALGLCSVIVAMIVKVISTPADQFGVEMPQFNLPDIAVLCYWGFLLISTLLSPYKDISFNGQGVRNDGFIIQSFYVAVYFLISHLLRLRKFDLNVYCLGATIVSGLVMLHFFGFDVLNTGFSKPNWESGLLFLGPMGNINLTSYFVTAALVLAAGIYITDQQIPFPKNGVVTLSCFALMLWAELNLNTDAGIVALGVVLLAAMPLMITSLRRMGRFMAILSVSLGVMAFDRLVIQTGILQKPFGATGYGMIAGAVFFCAAAAFIGTDFGPAFVSRVRERADSLLSRRRLLIATLSIDAAAVIALFIAAFVAAKTRKSGVLYELGQIVFHGNFNDKFGHNRLFTWKRTLKLAGKNPVFGSGPDTFCTVFNEAYGEESRKFFGGRNLDKAHNEYLQLLICSGITSLGAFLTFIGSLIVRAYRRAADNPLLVCCGAAVIAYAVHAFFGYSLPINTPLMWVLLGLTGAAVRVSTEND